MNIDNIESSSCAVLSAQNAITTYSNRNTSGNNTTIKQYNLVGEVFYKYREYQGNFPSSTYQYVCIDPNDLKGSTPTSFYTEIISLSAICVLIFLFYKMFIQPWWRRS